MHPSKILEELQKYKTTDRNQALNEFVQIRLTKSLQNYYDELDKAVQTTYNNNHLRIIKKINSIDNKE